MSVHTPADDQRGGSKATVVVDARRPRLQVGHWQRGREQPRWLHGLHWLTALAGYTALTLALTFPLLFHLGDSLAGPILFNDSLWYTWYPYAFRTALLAGQDPSTTHLLYALLPPIQLFAASDLNGALGALLLSVLVPLAVFNVLTLLNFILSGFTTYLLVGEFVRSRWAAFVAGAMFTFSTYHFWRVLNGLSLASMQWMPLAAYAVFVFYRRPGWRHALGMGLSLALLPLSDFYTTAYFVPLFALGMVGGLLVFRRDWLRQPRHLLQAGMGLAVTAAITLPLLRSSLQVDPTEQAAIAQKATGIPQGSANIIAYLFPSPGNILFGRFTVRLYQHIPLGISPESADYLGIVVLALALYGLLAIRQRPRAQVFWLIFGCGAFLLSLGTSLQVGGHSLMPLPFYGLLYNWPILSNFRYPTRIAPVVLLAVCVLAGYGLDALFTRVHARLNRPAAAPAPASGQAPTPPPLSMAPLSTAPSLLLSPLASAAPSIASTARRWQRLVRQLAVPALGVVLLSGSLAEHLQFAVPYPFTPVPMPPVYAQMAADPVPGLVLTLPVYPKGADMFYQTVYHRGLVGGYPIRTTIPMERSYENLPGVSFFDWPNGYAAKDPHADRDGVLHDIFVSAPPLLPPQESFLQGLQANHIRYVVLRFDTTGISKPYFPPILPWMKPWLEQQLGAPFYDDPAQQLTVWRIAQLPPGQDPTPTLTRFVLGEGWLPGLKLDQGQIVRGVLQQAQLTIGVPQATRTHLVLRVAAVGGSRTLAVHLNGTLLATQTLPAPASRAEATGAFQTLDVGVVALHAGDNTLLLGSTQPCGDRAPGATYPATLDPACLMFQVAAVQLLPLPVSTPATEPVAATAGSAP